MEKIFSKEFSLKAPGGDGYEWKEVETAFSVSERAVFAIKIEACAKNAQQNRSKDDDDLRVALDGFDFGKYERHQEMISWKGFGASASWDGASLKGGTKTIYYFVELEVGLHALQFFADETPTLKNIEILKIQNNTFELKNLKPLKKIKSERKGIPWLSFIFLGAQTKIFTLAVNTKSAKEKGGTDGDNLKIIVNGKIQKNPYAIESYKYKNFYFSGDIKEFDIFSIVSDELTDSLAFENAVELWYDETPEISSLEIKYFDNEAFLNRLKEFVDLKTYIIDRAHKAISIFKLAKKPYSAQFLEHSLNPNPSSLIFEPSDSLIKKIKDDPVYEKILKKLQEKISKGNLDGEIWPEDFKDDMEMKGTINLNSYDLDTAIHGIHKIEYKAKPKKNNRFDLGFTLFDIYDFEKQNVPFFLSHVKDYLKNTTINALDMGEGLGLVNNFEVEIRLKEILYVDY